MTTVLVSAGVALAAVILVALLARYLVRRSRRSSEQVLAEAVEQLGARVEAMGRDFTDALERVQEEGRRSRILGEVAGSIDLDEVLARTLDAAGALPGVDAAHVAASAHEGEPVVAALGLSTEEIGEHKLAAPQARRLRSITLDYNAGPESADEVDTITAGLGVPLPGETGPVGLLTIFTRSEGNSFGEEELSELERLALRAGPAIENARRFREARQLADLDALTGLHNRRYFHETLAREVARAHRYNRRLTLIVVDLDEFKAINDRIGHLAGDTVLAEIAARVRDVVRSADIACRVGGDEFAVILPESTLEDADQLYRRLQSAVSSRPAGQAGGLLVSAGVAELKPDDDSISFFQRADQALYRAKEAGKGQLVITPNTGPASPAPGPPMRGISTADGQDR